MDISEKTDECSVLRRLIREKNWDGSMVKAIATGTKTRVQILRAHGMPGGHGSLLVHSVREGGDKGSLSKRTSQTNQPAT